MGSVLGSLARRDKGTAPVLPNLQAPPDPTAFWEHYNSNVPVLGAAFRNAIAGPHSTQNAKAIYESRYYDQIVQALNAEGEQSTDYVKSPVLRSSPFYNPIPGEQVQSDGTVLIPVKRSFANPFSEGPLLTKDVNPLQGLYWGGDAQEINNIWSAVQRVRQRKPDFLKGFSDRNAVDALAMQHRQADQASSQAVLDAHTDPAAKVVSFVGGVGAGFAAADPETFTPAFAGAGAAGKSIARQVIRHALTGAATNAVVGGLALPGQMADANRMGQPMTTEDAVHSVGENALAGAILGTAHVAIPEGAKAVGTVASNVGSKVAENLPAPIRDPIVAASIRAGTVKDRDLLHEFQRAHNPYSVVDTSTPEERAAAHVLNKDIETQEQSPLQPSQAPAHGQRLDAIASALGVDLTPSDAPTTAPVQTATVRDHSETATVPRRPASLAEATVSAEGRDARNPASTADGYGQFTEGTWRHMIHTYAPQLAAGKTDAEVLALRHDKAIGTQMTALYGQENARYLRGRGLEDSPGNLSLAHFLGPSDAAKVLRADPSTPIEGLIDHRSFEANRKLLSGKSADQVIAWAHKRIGATVDHAPARPDAVPDEGFDYTSPVPYAVEQFRPDELPPTSVAAPTDEPFNPNLAQHLLVWEREDGTRELIDGGKRLAHARSQEDQSVTLPSVVLREKDGISEEMAMLVGKLKNVNLGTTSLEEAAGTLADIPEIAGALRNPEFRSEIAAIAQLPHEQFGAVVNGAIDPIEAARAADSERTTKLAQQVRDYWSFQKENGHRRKTVQIVTTPEGAIRTWAASASEGAVAHQFRDGDTITRLKPDDHATLDALLEKLNGGNEAPLARGNANRRRAGEPPRPEGRDLALEAADADVSGSREPSLFDRAITARDGAQRFSDPVGPEVKAHTGLLEHDLRPPQEELKADEGEEPKAPPVADDVHLFDLPSTGFRLSEEGDKPVSLKQALDEADADEVAAKALRDCL